jgi:hypothetical protein
VEVDVPVDRVFAYLSDFTTTTAWDPGTVRTVLRSGDGGVGSTYHNTSSFRGRETELIYEVTDLRENELFGLRGENKTLVARDTMEFSTTPSGGSRVTYTADFTFKGLAKLIEPFLGSAFKTLGDDAERGLQETLGTL